LKLQQQYLNVEFSVKFKRRIFDEETFKFKKVVNNHQLKNDLGQHHSTFLLSHILTKANMKKILLTFNNSHAVAAAQKERERIIE
jgi:hypothetical protein